MDQKQLQLDLQNPEYKWDLDYLLDNKSWDEYYKIWLNLRDQIIQAYPNFLDSLELFKKWTKLNDEFEIVTNRVMNYISNNLNEDQANPTFIGYSQAFSKDCIPLNTTLSSFANVVLKNEEKIREYLKDATLSVYTKYYDNILRYKPYVLSPECELLKTKLSISNPGFETIYSTLLDNDIKFKNVKDKNKKVVPLNTVADVFSNLKSKDGELRKNTYLSFGSALDQYKATLTQTLYFNYMMLNAKYKANGFEDYISAIAFDDEIERPFINHVYDMVKKYAPLIKKYREMRSKLLKHIYKLDKVMPWDGRLELYNKEVHYTIPQAQQEAKNALRILGDDYVNLLQKAFDERWISWLPKPGKQTGAYSIGGTRGLEKYFISMNFDYSLYSVSTLVHELGHSLNSYYFGKEQPVYADCSIFYAEVSSISNEVFLNHYLLNKYNNDAHLSLMILDEMISNFFATTTRQVIFSNFEAIANQWVNQGSGFTYEKVAQTYRELCDEYMQTKTATDKKYQKPPYCYDNLTPLRISHFYMGNFYVYKYAIGQVAAIVNAYNILNNKPNAKDNYFKFLSSGMSLSPLETIKLLNIDLTQSQPWQEAGSIVESWINDFIKIGKKILKSK